MATIDDFKKLDLRIATVTEAREHPDADRLYILTVDAGDGEDRQIVAGVRGHYAPEALKGRQVVLVSNLEPAVIRGVESRGMLLAARDEDGLSILMPERSLKPGARVS